MSDHDSDSGSDFGDFDPEDEWDDGDDEEVKLRVLERVIESIRRRRDDADAEPRRIDALRLVGKLEDRQVRRRAHRRLSDIREQLETM